MIPAHTFCGKHVAVFGLGRSGEACCKALMAGGAEVRAWDDRFNSADEPGPAGLPLDDLRNVDFSELDALVLAPGVPLTHPEPHWTVKKAKAAGVEIIGDTEILMREISGAGARTACITGTNGKSTTTALIGHVLNSAGRDSHIGGNIGTACLSLPEPIAERIYVLELSSYQIDLTPSLRPDVGILLNLSPDHLDRHGTMENYAAVKARMFAQQNADQVAIVSIDDDWSRAIADTLSGPQPITRLTTGNDLEDGVIVKSGIIQRIADGETVERLDISRFTGLRGRHNWQNASAAYAACRALGLSVDEIAAGMKTFPGLAHRMQQIARKGEILFINDSKATNADAAACALDSFDTIYWIAGGRAKDGGIDSLERFFPKIEHAYLIGEAADDFAKTLNGSCPVSISGTVEKAVADSARDVFMAKCKEGAVLFSPACASFDQFADFEKRGEAFCRAVAALPDVTLSPGVLTTC